MKRPEPIAPQRVRRIPPQFSWVDHRLARDRHVVGRSAEALALYLFLVTVADAQGLSWYSEISLSRWLPLSPEAIGKARQELVDASLIAYRKPVYQVLDLAIGTEPVDPAASAARRGEMASMGEVLRKTLGGRR